VVTRLGQGLDDRVDAFLRRRFGGRGLYGTPEPGWWPQLRMVLVCNAGVALLVLIALAVSGRLAAAPVPLAMSTGFTAWYAVCLAITVRVRARRARGARGPR